MVMKPMINERVKLSIQSLKEVLNPLKTQITTPPINLI